MHDRVTPVYDAIQPILTVSGCHEPGISSAMSCHFPDFPAIPRAVATSSERWKVLRTSRSRSSRFSRARGRSFLPFRRATLVGQGERLLEGNV